MSSGTGSGGDYDVVRSDAELVRLQRMSRIPRPVRRPPALKSDADVGESSEVLTGHELAAVSRPLLYQPPDTRVCYFYRDGNDAAAPVKLVVNRRVYPNVDVLKDELTRRVEGLPFGVRGIYTPAGRDAVRSLSDLQQDGRYVCTTFAMKARGVDVGRADTRVGHVWRTGARPGSDGQRELNAILRGYDDTPSRATDRHDGDGGPKRLAWDTPTDSENSAENVRMTSRTPKKIVVVRHGDALQRQTLLLYRGTAQTFEQVLVDLSSMFKMPVKNMFTVDGVQVGLV